MAEMVAARQGQIVSGTPRRCEDCGERINVGDAIYYTYQEPPHMWHKACFDENSTPFKDWLTKK